MDTVIKPPSATIHNSTAEDRFLLVSRERCSEQQRKIDEIVELNVGGQYFATAKSTLCRFKGTMLETMFNGNWELKKDSNGRYFVDRNPKLFAVILDFLRDPEAPIELPCNEEKFKREVEYYGLTRFIFNTCRSVSFLFPSDISVIANKNIGSDSCYKTGDRILQSFSASGLICTGRSHWKFEIDNNTVQGMHRFSLSINNVCVGECTMEHGKENKVFDLEVQHPQPVFGNGKDCDYNLQIMAISTVSKGKGNWKWLFGGAVELFEE